MSKLSLNIDYFKEINSFEKAYWLGFICADGCIHKNGGKLTITVKDREICEKLRKIFTLSKSKKIMYNVREVKNKRPRSGHLFLTAITTKSVSREDIDMRLRNVPGARDTIAESGFVVQESIMFEMPGKWAEIFGNDHPIHIEIGMGKGQFIHAMAKLHPEINYVGVEKYSSVLLRAIQKMEQEELSVVFITHDEDLAHAWADKIYRLQDHTLSEVSHEA